MADAGDVLPLIELFRALPPDRQRQVVRRYGEDDLLAKLLGEGSLRAAQRAPAGDWGMWVILAGRGFGKTHAGAEWVHAHAAGIRPRRIALVAPTLDAARAVMVEGESGLLARLPPGEQLTWQASAKRLRWSNGSEARIYSGAEPDALRGGQFDYAWGDEFAHWAGGEDMLMNLRMATRLGPAPQIMLTTTPLPLAWLKSLIAEPDVVVTRGATSDNATNLPKTYVARLEKRFGGTATGRQEMAGEIVDDLEGSLWTRALIDRQRVTAPPHGARVVVGVDPPAGGGTCGIVVTALGQDGHAYVLDDASVSAQRPEQWARAVVKAADRWQADRVIAEVNQGGEMVIAMLKSVDAALPVTAVRASRGKVARAEPVAALYGEGRVFHAGVFPALEDQLCGLLVDGRYAGPGTSPDRADACVWALTALLLAGRTGLPTVRNL
ncbi:terminase large subunit domain-containing protein [Sandarakinorhabdus sp.]|uniref:DNA-packaging protein n=1 Tax=Sandarakinorhabdus sp. TaxID=1916663 RepID=UPI00286DBE0C|nr:terminase family protein [Sandarakinorhabdus sp.]